MLNAPGYVTKQANGRYKGTLPTASAKADIDTQPIMWRTADSQLGFRLMTEDCEIEAGWTRKGETSNKKCIILSIAAPELGPKKLYGYFGKTAGSDDKDLYTEIWNPGD
jgi:uncharacterized protein (DUF736 family)